jgi:hypothetical protein
MRLRTRIIIMASMIIAPKTLTPIFCMVFTSNLRQNAYTSPSANIIIHQINPDGTEPASIMEANKL